MKTIKLEEYADFTTKEVLSTIVKTIIPTSGGADIEQIRYRLKIVNKLEAALGKLELEDAEYDHLRDLVEDFKFAIVSEDLVSIVDAVYAAAGVETAGNRAGRGKPRRRR